MAKYVPRPFTGYLNFSPDIVSSDYAEPRAQNLNEQEARRIRASKIGAQNTKILRSASKPAPKVSRFGLGTTQARKEEDKRREEKRRSKQ